MKNIFKIIFLLAMLAIGSLSAQDLQSKGIQTLYTTSDPNDYTVGEGGDTTFARYLLIEYLSEPAGAKYTVLLQNVTDTSAIVQLTNTQFTVPGSDVDNNGLYSLDRTGNTVRVFLGNISLFSRTRIKVWIENDEQPSYATDF
jgi:hypothetical protein